MNIVVCMKRVPDTSSVGRVEINASGLDIEKKLLGFKINEWDEYALEEAVQVNKRLGGSITAVTIGTKECDDMLRRALALGAHKAIRIDEDMTLADSFMVAETLVSLLRVTPYDLLLFGMQSEDFGMANLGVMVAEMLGVPHAAGIVKLDARSEHITVWRELEGGVLEVYAIKLPALLTIQTGINHPRYPSYLNIKKAREKELKVMTLADLGLDKKSLRRMVTLDKLEFPRIAKRGEILSGLREETAAKLSNILKNLGIL